MKRYLLALLLSGCATYPEYVGIDYPVQSPYYTPTQPPLISYSTQLLQEHLQRTDAESEKLKAFVQQSTNRRDLLNALIQSEQANRRLYQLLQNPWNGFYLMR